MNEVYLPLGSRRKLIDLSRQTLDHLVRGIERPSARVDDPYLQSRDYGAFVSLHKNEELRGCIGRCASRAPLFETVIEMTEAAASEDYRVQPVAQSELGAIRIDITVLSPLTVAHDPLSLEADRHGLQISRRGKRGVLLPQVARRYRWDMKTFLEQTCLKADLQHGVLRQYVSTQEQPRNRRRSTLPGR